MKLKATVTSDLAKTTNFDVEVKALSAADRTNKAVKRALLFLALALVSVPVIALHFVLVPSFLGLSVYSFFSILKQHYSIQGDELTCPGCMAKIKGPKSSFNWPLKTRCPKCQLQIRIQPAEATLDQIS